MRGRKQGVDSLGEAVVPFAVEPGMELGPGVHDIAGEGQPAFGPFQKVRHPAGAVAAGVEAPELAAAPGEVVHLLERKIELDRLDGRPDVACAVDAVRVPQRGLHLAKLAGPLEERSFRIGGGQLHAGSDLGRGQAGRSLALLAMMVREEDPLDAGDADLAEMIEDAAVPKVDQQGRVAVLQDIDIAGVGPEVEVGEQFLEGHGGTIGRGTRLSRADEGIFDADTKADLRDTKTDKRRTDEDEEEDEDKD